MIRCAGRWVIVAVAAQASHAEARAPRQPVDLVDPFMGATGDRGQLAPAAAAPFGMVQLAPDTTPANHAGYDGRATVLRGFSQTRAQGVGCRGGGGDLLAQIGYRDEAAPWRMDKASERAGAGWYTVRYGRTAIDADLAAGQSVSISRFRASATGMLAVGLDPGHGYAGAADHRWIATRADDLRVRIDNPTVCGKGTYHLFVAATLSLNGRPLRLAGTADGGDRLGFTVPVRAGDALELRVGLSVVDARSARATLVRELGATSLPMLVARTRRDWNRILSRIAIEDADTERRRLFYTCLFRALQMPARLDDADGVLRTPDGRLSRAPRGRHRYGGWSLWDNYRTQMPLVALVAPDIARDVAASLVDLFRTDKAQWATPTEPFLTVRTEHAGIALLDLVRKGLGPSAPGDALPGMVREADALPRATPDQRLELAYDEWAIAQLADDVGKHRLAIDFNRRWRAYRPLWLAVFRELGPDADTVKARGLYQGTLWQYRWAPVFDLPWLRDVALGRDRFVGELGMFFDRQLFNMTNEPDIQAPFLFGVAGQPARADAIVSTLRDRPYPHWYENQGKYPAPLVQPSFSLTDGFAEGMDDDGGAMSAWYVWASLGLYPLVPGEPWYQVGTPAFRIVRLAVGRASLVVERHRPADATGSVTLNARSLPDRRLDHHDLTRGGLLIVNSPR